MNGFSKKRCVRLLTHLIFLKVIKFLCQYHPAINSYHAFTFWVNNQRVDLDFLDFWMLRGKVAELGDDTVKRIKICYWCPTVTIEQFASHGFRNHRLNVIF